MGNVKATSASPTKAAAKQPAQQPPQAPSAADPSLAQVLGSPTMAADQLALNQQPSPEVPASGDVGQVAAYNNYLAQKVQNATQPMFGAGFFDGVAELDPFYKNKEENQIRQQYAQIAYQVAQQTVDPSDPQAKEKIDALFAHEEQLANQEIANLPLNVAGRETGQAIDTGYHVAKAGTFDAAGASTGFFGSIFSGIGNFFGGISHWFSSNANN